MHDLGSHRHVVFASPPPDWGERRCRRSVYRTEEKPAPAVVDAEARLAASRSGRKGPRAHGPFLEQRRHQREAFCRGIRYSWGESGLRRRETAARGPVRPMGNAGRDRRADLRDQSRKLENEDGASARDPHGAIHLT